jgi:hypothetical protein
MFRLICTGAAFATVLAAQQHTHLQHSAEEYAKVLDDPERDSWQKRMRWFGRSG